MAEEANVDSNYPNKPAKVPRSLGRRAADEEANAASLNYITSKYLM